MSARLAAFRARHAGSARSDSSVRLPPAPVGANGTGTASPETPAPNPKLAGSSRGELPAAGCREPLPVAAVADPPAGWDAAAAWEARDWWEHLQERAGILEHDAGLSRDEAERRACRERDLLRHAANPPPACPPDRCAGCGDPVFPSGAGAVPVPADPTELTIHGEPLQ